MTLFPMGTLATADLNEVRFGMLKDREAMVCFVDRDAIDDIEGATTTTNAERLAIFDRHRERFETIVSAVFDAKLELRVTSKNLQG